MWWCIADPDTTWEIPAGTSRLRLTLHWTVTTMARICGDGWWCDWASPSSSRGDRDRVRPDIQRLGFAGRKARAVRSVEEQQARITAAAVAPRPIRVAIAEAQGLMCAEEVVTERPLPGFDQAAIDGYAVRSVDVLGVGEVGVDAVLDEGGEPIADEDARDG